MDKKEITAGHGITTGYEPDQCINEFGWLWADIDSRGRRWWLVATRLPDGIDAEPFIRFIDPSDHPEDDFEEHAENYAGRPYLPLSSPACVPGDNLLLRAWFAPGAQMQLSYKVKADADAAMKQIGLLTGKLSK